MIQPGDVLHCDVGITYLRLNTDTQEMGAFGTPRTRIPDDVARRAMKLNR